MRKTYDEDKNNLHRKIDSVSSGDEDAAPVCQFFFVNFDENIS